MDHGERNQEGNSKFLGGTISRRQALKVGGIAALGLTFSKPIIETIMPKPAFANYVGSIAPACSPGFWKTDISNHGGTQWPHTGYGPDDNFNTVFDRSYYPRGGNKGGAASTTLYESVGGGIAPGLSNDSLGKHATSALLSAAHPGVDFSIPGHPSATAADVIAFVQDAIDDGDSAAVAALIPSDHDCVAHSWVP